MNTSTLPVGACSTGCFSFVLIGVSEHSDSAPSFTIKNKGNIWTHFPFLESLGGWPRLCTKNYFCLPLEHVSSLCSLG